MLKPSQIMANSSQETSGVTCSPTIKGRSRLDIKGLSPMNSPRGSPTKTARLKPARPRPIVCPPCSHSCPPAVSLTAERATSSGEGSTTWW
ncbi:MAG: hypothetical protein RQM92_13320 [Candidatus Syntrophopropionicum ammoniitolerans]